MFKSFLQSLKKSRQLKRVSRSLSQPIDFKNLSKLGSKSKYIEELIDICESDELVKMIMGRYKADRETLKLIYDRLILTGAGQYTKGHYVAASSLAFPLTLKFLLEHYKDSKFSIKNFDTYNSELFIAYRLITYFENGETGEVSH